MFDVWTQGEEYTDNSVVANKEYQYRVTAENEGGESQPSEPSDVIKARPLKGSISKKNICWLIFISDVGNVDLGLNFAFLDEVSRVESVAQTFLLWMVDIDFVTKCINSPDN